MNGIGSKQSAKIKKLIMANKDLNYNKIISVCSASALMF